MNGVIIPVASNNSVPPTPRYPAACNDLVNRANEHFNAVMWLESDKKEEELFSEYDGWEIYDEKKCYSKRAFLAINNKQLHNYCNYLACVKRQDKEQYYVLYKRLRNEREQYYDYCPCLRCQAAIINPLKYLWCDHCLGCLRSDFYKKEYLVTAKEQAFFSFVRKAELSFVLLILLWYLFL